MKSGVRFGGEAAYREVARKLRSRIGAETLARENGTLPSYRELAAEFGVSICVIQNAMKLLQAESLVKVHHGKAGRATGKKELETELMKFGMIHPYVPDISFGQLMPYIMMRALELNQCRALLTIQSSEHVIERERAIAENLVYNGVDGICLSPAAVDGNVDFFEELSRQVPVMLFDQPLEGSSLPAVIIDFAEGGRLIGRDLAARRKKRVLALVNSTNNHSIDAMLAAMGDEVELYPLALPFFTAESDSITGDLRCWNQVVAELRHTLETHSFDAVFSPFDHAFDFFYCSEIPELLRRDKLSVVLNNGLVKSHSRNYVNSDLIVWEYSNIELLRLAVERMLRWKNTRRRPVGCRKLKITFSQEYHFC